VAGNEMSKQECEGEKDGDYQMRGTAEIYIMSISKNS